MAHDGSSVRRSMRGGNTLGYVTHYTLNRPKQSKRYVHDTDVNVDNATTATATTTQQADRIHINDGESSFEAGARVSSKLLRARGREVC